MSGAKPFSGSSVVMRPCTANPLRGMASWAGMPMSASCNLRPAAIRICERTRSTSVISSVMVCSTWMRGFISMKNHSPLSASTRNSTVPALS